MSTTTTPPFVFAPLPCLLPKGYSAAPISEGERAAMVRVCAVLRSGAGPAQSPLVLLRETLDAKVFLGALMDAAGVIHEFLELWVQDTSGLSNALPGYRQALTNTVLDQRWTIRAESFAKGGAAGLLTTGWEQKNPAPTFIEIKSLSPVPARDKRNGAEWALCRDEGLLARKSVPGYATTTSRHLFQPEMGEETPLLPLDVVGLDPAAMGVGGAAEIANFNGGGGMMMVRPYAPLSYEQYIDAITGVVGEAGSPDVLLASIAAAARGQSGKRGGWLNLSAAGTPARLIESLHLKLMILAGAVASVRSAVATTQTPLLNVTAQSFRVRLARGAGTLPLWWTAQAELAEPGEGVELPIEGTSARYYLASGGGMSIYTPAAMGRSASGKGWLRLREVIGEAGGTILEGTLSTQDRITPGSNDLLWLRTTVGQTRVDLYGTIDADAAMASGELRVRTIPQRLSEDVTARLKAAMGVPIPDVSFEVVPLLSSPCDLYALGVLAVRTLLVGPKRPLPVALDEILSLAAQAGKEAEDGADLPTRLMQVFESDKKWATVLGPQSLLAEVTEADEAFLTIPPRLWFATLAMVVRMFTGLTPDSRCRDLGDAPGGGIHKVFDGVLDDLYALLTASRGLIVSDQGLSADIRGVVQECLAVVRR